MLVPACGSPTELRIRRPNTRRATLCRARARSEHRWINARTFPFHSHGGKLARPAACRSGRRRFAATRTAGLRRNRPRGAGREPPEGASETKSWHALRTLSLRLRTHFLANDAGIAATCTRSSRLACLSRVRIHRAALAVFVEDRPRRGGDGLPRVRPRVSRPVPAASSHPCFQAWSDDAEPHAWQQQRRESLAQAPRKPCANPLLEVRIGPALLAPFVRADRFHGHRTARNRFAARVGRGSSYCRSSEIEFAASVQ